MFGIGIGLFITLVSLKKFKNKQEKLHHSVVKQQYKTVCSLPYFKIYTVQQTRLSC